MNYQPEYALINREYHHAREAMASASRTLNHLSVIADNLMAMSEIDGLDKCRDTALMKVSCDMLAISTVSPLLPGTEGIVTSIRETLEAVWKTIYEFFAKVVKRTMEFLGISSKKEEARVNNEVKKAEGRANKAAGKAKPDDVKRAQSDIKGAKAKAERAKSTAEKLRVIEEYNDIEYELLKAANLKRASDLSNGEMSEIFAALGSVRSYKDLEKVVGRNSKLIDDYKDRYNAMLALVEAYVDTTTVEGAVKLHSAFMRYVEAEINTFTRVKNNVPLGGDYFFVKSGVKIKGKKVPVLFEVSTPTIHKKSVSKDINLTPISYNEYRRINKMATEILEHNFELCGPASTLLGRANALFSTISPKGTDSAASRQELVMEAIKKGMIEGGISSNFVTKIPILLMKESKFITSYSQWLTDARIAVQSYIWQID